MTSSAACSELSLVASKTLKRCELLAQESESADGITRTFCSGAMAGAHRLLREWMSSIKLDCRMDAACNLFGTTNSPIRKAKFLIGSHIDSVPNGGRYDGALGVVLGIALVELLGESVHELPFSIEVVAFSEEEGVRFRSPYIGSRALAGCFVDELLGRCDDHGLSFTDVIESFGGCAGEIASCKLDPRDYLAFLEPHIEQGPVLEDEGLAVGVVNGIAGQTRVTARFVGRASHAGTTPMRLRQDALTAAADWITQVEQMANQTTGLLATVGHLLVSPNVPNVIPGEVSVRLDARHLDDAVRIHSVEALRTEAESIAARRGLNFFWERCEEQPAVLTDPNVSDMLAQSIADLKLPVRHMQSGAGHDAVIMAPLLPTTMLFIRCKGGISHHPDESVDLCDIGESLRVMLQFVRRLATLHSAPTL